jgi:hypothetical protein
MKKLYFALLFLSQISYAQDTQVARLFQEEQRTFHCERYEKLLSAFDDLAKDEIKSKIQDEITGYTILMKSGELSYRERRVYRENRGVLKKLLRYVDYGETRKERNEQFCRVAETAVISLIRGLGWGANGIMSSAAIPFQAVWKFGRAAVSGEKQDGPGQNQYDFFGPTIYGGTASNLLFSERYIGLAMANPWLIPLLAAPFVDSRLMDMCKRKNSLRPDEEKYCGKYIGFKTTMTKLSEPAEDAGEWVHRLIVGPKDEKEEDQKTYSQEEILKNLTRLNNSNFCTEMVKIGEKYRASRKQIQANANRETWRIGTYPERYGVPGIADFETSADRLLLTPTGKVEKLRNIVISLGPPAWQVQGVDKKAVLKNYKRRYKEFKKQATAGRKIFQDSDTVAACEELKQKHKFDYEEFEELATEIEDDQIGRKLYEHEMIKAQFTSKASPFILSGGTKMKWELIETGDITQIHQLLRQSDIANVILVIHGTEKGKIIDSQMNELPRTFFKNLSPSIMSVNFFSCFSQKIDDYYGLSEEMNSSSTENAIRHLSFVETDDTYSYKAGQVPLQSFGGFLSQVDLYMYHSLRGNLLHQNLSRARLAAPAAQMCTLNVENLGNKKVTYSVTINNFQVGALTPEMPKSEFQFDCSLLKNAGNKIRFLNIQLSHDEPLSLEEAQISLVRPAGVLRIDMDDLAVTALKGNVLGLTGQFD